MIPALLCLALLLPMAAEALIKGSTEPSQQCLVVGIADGDTLTARCGTSDNYRQVKVRLAGIDAPEKAQAFGNASKQHLSDLCFQRQAVIKIRLVDRYGRSVADVECKGQDVGESQVKAGMAWVYTQYAQGYTRLPQLQITAQTSKRGLWADKTPVAPWEFRRPSATKTATQPTTPKHESSAAHSNKCFTGARGGTYTITASGRKNYAGC